MFRTFFRCSLVFCLLVSSFGTSRIFGYYNDVVVRFNSPAMLAYPDGPCNPFTDCFFEYTKNESFGSSLPLRCWNGLAIRAQGNVPSFDLRYINNDSTSSNDPSVINFPFSAWSALAPLVRKFRQQTTVNDTDKVVVYYPIDSNGRLFGNLRTVYWQTDELGVYDVLGLLSFTIRLYAVEYAGDVSALGTSYQPDDGYFMCGRLTGSNFLISGQSYVLKAGTTYNCNALYQGRFRITNGLGSSFSTDPTVMLIGDNVGFPHVLGTAYANPISLYPVVYSNAQDVGFKNFRIDSPVGSVREYAQYFAYAYSANGTNNYCVGVPFQDVDNWSYYAAIRNISYDLDGGGEPDAHEFYSRHVRTDPLDDWEANGEPDAEWVEIGPYTEDKLIDSYNNGPEFDSRLLNGIPSDLPTDELEDPELQDVPIFGDDEKSGLQMAVQTELENNNAYGALKLVLQQGSSLQSVGNMPAYTLPSFFPTEYNGYRFVVPQNNVVLDFGQMFRDNMQFKGAWDVLRAIFGLLLFAGVVVFIVWDALKLLKD